MREPVPSRRRAFPGWLATVLAFVLLLAPALVASGAETDPATSPPDAVAAASGEETPLTKEEPPSGDTSGPKSETSDLPWAVDGHARAAFRFRQTGSEQDLDLTTDLVANFRHRGDLSIRARLNGRAYADLLENQDPDDELRDYWDGRDGDLHGRLYEAYVELEKAFDGALTLRAGRQFLDEGVWFHFDGLRADIDVAKVLPDLGLDLDLSAVGGVPVTFDEEDRTGRWMGGIVIRGRLTRETTLRFEYYHLREDFDGLNEPVTEPIHQPVAAPEGHIDDDYLGLSAWHRIGKTIRLFGRFSLLNGDANELHLRGRWMSEDGVWTFVLEHFYLFERLANVTNDLTPYVPMLGSYEPFWRIGGRAEWRPDDHWVVQTAYTRRVLEDDDDEGTFNHEYDHYFAGVTAIGLVDPRLDVSVFVNGYESSVDDVVAAGGSVDFRARTDLVLSAGIDYALFEYDWFQDSEREDVWTYSLRARWRLTEDADLRARLSVDDDRFRRTTTLDVSLTVRF